MKDERNAVPEDAGADAGHACEACGAPALATGRVSTVFRANGGLALVRDIPALICGACGEEYIDDVTAMRLDLMRGQGFASETPADTMEIPVYDYRRGKEPGS